jgi:hypothetical protein
MVLGLDQQRELQELKVQRGLKGLKDLRVRLVHKEQQVLKEQKVLMGLKELKVHKDRKELKVLRVL